ncbi:hypothetical protein [Paraliobacillus sp. JSM ZJ581]|uniref:hypothetical protein n=1 Tax=Paraliobacillus sp. JSM ZJ581 TaxID=3342118 RepID=UPI0035A848B0
MDKFRGKYTVTAILSTLGVGKSTYYRWTNEPIKLMSEAAIAIIITRNIFKKTRLPTPFEFRGMAA